MQLTDANLKEKSLFYYFNKSSFPHITCHTLNYTHISCKYSNKFHLFSFTLKLVSITSRKLRIQVKNWVQFSNGVIRTNHIRTTSNRTNDTDQLEETQICAHNVVIQSELKAKRGKTRNRCQSRETYKLLCFNSDWLKKKVSSHWLA